MKRRVGMVVPPSPQKSPNTAPAAGSDLRCGSPGTQAGQFPDQDLARTMWSMLMQHIVATDNYRPARLAVGKETMVVFWVMDPATQQLRRIKEKLNYIEDPRERRRYGMARVRDLNLKLAVGWNPLQAGETAKSGTPIATVLERFLVSKERDGLEKDSMRSYRSLCHILRSWLMGKGMDIHAITAFSEVHARSFMDDCYVQRALSNRSFNNYLQFYVSLWNWMSGERYIKANPFMGLKRKRVDKEAKSFRPPTDAERAAIRCDLEQHNPRFLTFCLLCFYCGIRPKEAFMLRPRDFHLHRQAIIIDGSVSKNDRTQGVAIPNKLMPAILELGLERQHPDHYVFSTSFQPGPKLHDSRTSGKEWDRMRRRIGLAKEVTMYQVKHAGAVAMARSGLGAVDLMNHLRHHDLAMTTIYTRQSDMDGVRAVLDKGVDF